MNGMVGWSDYEGIDGFGAATQNDIRDLNKALTAGAEINAPGAATAGDGFALRVESLEATLKVVTYRMENIRLWRALPKLAAYNTVEEHNRLLDYGSNPDAGWISEGDLPEEDDSTYERDYAVVKFLGTTRKVSLQMTLVKPANGNVIARETVNGTMHLLKMLETGLFTGDSDLSALQFDGFRKLMRDNAPAANIIDLRGQPLTEDAITDAALVASDAPNYGQITDIFMNPKNKADLVKGMYPRARYDLLEKTKDGMIGLDVRGMTTPAGDVRFQPDVFITDGGAVPAAAVGDTSKIPAIPVVSTGATTPVLASALFGADDAGDYFYEAVACNRYGKSAKVSIGGAVTVAEGDEVTFGLTPGSAVTVSWYEIYRTVVGGAAGTERLILRVPNAAGVGEQTINDVNAYLPGCYTAYGFQNNLEAMSCKQLAPMLKVPLATIDTSIRWAQVVFVVPVIYAYGKHVIFENVGRAAGSVG